MKSNKSKKIILFDGVCALCNSSVRWVIKRDKKKIFMYAPLQGATARNVIKPCTIPDSIVLLENETMYTRSSAVLRIARELPFPWDLLSVFTILPKPLRDWAYSYISKNRYSWFGKYDTCTIPSVDEQDLFLD